MARVARRTRGDSGWTAHHHGRSDALFARAPPHARERRCRSVRRGRMRRAGLVFVAFRAGFSRVRRHVAERSSRLVVTGSHARCIWTDDLSVPRACETAPAPQRSGIGDIAVTWLIGGLLLIVTLLGAPLFAV